MVDDPTTRPSLPVAPHRPWLAAVLSFAFPGLGQAYAGRARDAVLFAAPVVLLVLVAAALATGIAGDRNDILSPEFLSGVLLANGALLVWRLAAIVHAVLAMPRPAGTRLRPLAGLAVASLVLVTIAMHAWVGTVVTRLETALGQVFQPVDEPGIVPSSPGTTGEPQPTRPPSNRWAGVDRINVLLVGTDAAPGRSSTLTDVILVVSVDPVDERAAMISVPRDTGAVPLPDDRLYPDGIFPGKVNELVATASADPDRWCPDLAPVEPDVCGLRTLQTVVGLYTGLEIHHYALVDMVGFAELIDALGGLELCLDGQLVDPEFDGSLENREPDEPLVLPAGCHHYGGLEALAYARSRQGWMELADGTRIQQTDFDRNERQQEVLLGLRREIAEADTILELPGIVAAIGRTVVTDVPREQAGDLAALLPLIAAPDIERLVLGHPEFVDLPVDPERNYLLLPKRDAIRDAIIGLVGRPALFGWYLGTFAPAPPPASPLDPAPSPLPSAP